MFLKFIPRLEEKNNNFDIILFHKDCYQNKKQKDFIVNHSSIKICAGAKKKNDLQNICDAFLKLPTTLKRLMKLWRIPLQKKNFT